MNGSVLWKLEKPEGRSSYLMGTMHVKDSTAYTHINKALNVLSFCSHYFGEIDLHEASQVIQPQDYMLPNNDTLENYINERHFKRMSSILLKAYGVHLAQLNRLYPLMITNQISELLLREDNNMALDQFLWMKASEQGMIMGGVESVRHQVDILHSLDLDTQIKALRTLCQHVQKFNKSVYKLVRLYEEEDIAEIYRMSKKQLGLLRKKMLYERNMAMADFIDSHSGLNAFYAIGAAHLGGNKGLLAILKRKGWHLTAL